MRTLALIVFIVVLGLFVLQGLITRFAHYKRKKLLAERPQLAIGEWYEYHWKSIGVSYQAAIKTAGLVSKHLCCDVTKLRPMDSFDDELSVSSWSLFGLDDDPIMEMVEEELRSEPWVLKCDRPPELLARVNTLGDLAQIYEALCQIDCGKPSRAGKCANCGYNLFGTESEKCPECGTLS